MKTRTLKHGTVAKPAQEDAKPRKARQKSFGDVPEPYGIATTVKEKAHSKTKPKRTRREDSDDSVFLRYFICEAFDEK